MTRNIYTSKFRPFCAYLTIYSGDKLSPYYIGSSSVYNVVKKIYINECKDHPELFITKILRNFKTREEATDCELELQIKYDVVKSKHFFNMAYAHEDKFFNGTIKGKDHPSFNKSNYINKFGKKFYLDNNDPMIVTNNLISLQTGYVMVKDKNSKILKVLKK